MAERVAPVCGWVTVTLAPTTTAPLGSVTTPVISPKVWAEDGTVVSANKRKTPASILRISDPQAAPSRDREGADPSPAVRWSLQLSQRLGSAPSRSRLGAKALAAHEPLAAVNPCR